MREQPNDSYLEFSRSILPGVEVKSCKNTPHAYKPHVHKELSLGYILRGTTNLTMNNKTVCYKKGDAVIIPPLLSHQCEPDDIDNWQYVMLYIDPAFYGNALSFSKPATILPPRSEEVYSFIKQLLSETDRSLAEDILIEMLNSYSEEPPGLLKPADAALLSIKTYIQSCLNKEVTLDNLQDTFNINKFTIIRSFKNAFSTTPGAYHLQCRIAHAKELLKKNTDVFDICSDLGFYDQAHFIKAFKAMHGITPAKYTEQLIN